VVETDSSARPPNLSRVSTDVTEQISRRFPGYSRRDF